MTKQNFRFTTNVTSDIDNNIVNIFIDMIESVESKRISTMPNDIHPESNSVAVFTYGDALLFEMAMMIRGDKPKDAAKVIGVTYQRLIRILNKFNRGKAIKGKRTDKANGYTIMQMIKYTYDTVDYLKMVLPKEDY